MKYFTKKIIAVLLTVMLTGITVLHVSGGQTIKVNAAQTFKVHFIDVGAADGALLQYGEGENAKYALIDSGAYSYETTDHDTIDVSDRVHQYLLDHGEKKISIELERNQNQAVLRISNQVTYPEQINIDHVFERFYKADAARSKTSTGLGLSIARELVSRMNGEIEAKIEKEEFIVEMRFPLVADEMGNILLSVTVE